MSNKISSYPESAGSRGFDVKLSGEDFYIVENLMSLVESPAYLRPADALAVRFEPYSVTDITRFALFREYKNPVAYVGFSSKKGQIKSVDLMVSDATDTNRSVAIKADYEKPKTYTMQDIHKSIHNADEAYIKDILYYILLEQNDTHSQDMTTDGLYEFCKLFHPSRTETHKYLHSSGFLLDGYINPNDINFAIAKATVSMQVERWFDSTHQFEDEPAYTELDIQAVTAMSISDSHAEGQGNMHMLPVTRSFNASKELNGLPTMNSAFCSSRIYQEPSRFYGKKERVFCSNIETIMAENNAKDKDFLIKIWDAVSLFKK